MPHWMLFGLVAAAWLYSRKKEDSGRIVIGTQLPVDSSADTNVSNDSTSSNSSGNDSMHCQKPKNMLPERNQEYLQEHHKAKDAYYHKDRSCSNLTSHSSFSSDISPALSEWNKMLGSSQQYETANQQEQMFRVPPPIEIPHSSMSSSVFDKEMASGFHCSMYSTASPVNETIQLETSRIIAPNVERLDCLFSFHFC